MAHLWGYDRRTLGIALDESAYRSKPPSRANREIEAAHSRRALDAMAAAVAPGSVGKVVVEILSELSGDADPGDRTEPSPEGKRGTTMVKRILVPLDGTPENEDVLPVVEDLARGAGANVRLLHVGPWPETVQAVDGRVLAYADQRVEALTTRCENYLGRVADRLGGLPVERAVRFGEAAEQILEDATAWAADLVMIFHAQPAGRWRASLAEQLQRKSDRTLLIYQPPPGAAAGPRDPASGCDECP